MIKTIEQLYLYSSIHIGVCAWSMYAFFSLSFDINLSSWYGVSLFFSTIVVYNVHRLLGMHKDPSLGHHFRYYMYASHHKMIVAVTILALLVSILSVCMIPNETVMYMLIPMMVTALYLLPVLRRGRRVRDVAFMKIPMVAFTWMFLTTTLPLWYSSVSSYTTVLLSIMVFLFVFAITIPFDIRDMDIDNSQNVSTFPTVLGVSGSKTTGVILLISSCLIIIALYTGSHIGGVFFVSWMITMLVSMALLMCADGSKSDRYYTLWMDGTLILPYILHQVLSIF